MVLLKQARRDRLTEILFLICRFSFELSLAYSFGSGLSAHIGTGGKCSFAAVWCNVELASGTTLVLASLRAEGPSSSPVPATEGDSDRTFFDARRVRVVPRFAFADVGATEDASDEYDSSSCSASSVASRITECLTLRFGRAAGAADAMTDVDATGWTGKAGKGGRTADETLRVGNTVVAAEFETGTGANSGKEKRASEPSNPSEVAGGSNTEGSMAKSSADPDKTGAVEKSSSARLTGLRPLLVEWSSDSGENGDPGMWDGMNVAGSKVE